MKYKTKKTKTKHFPTKPLLVVGAVLVLSLAGWFYVSSSNGNAPAEQSDTQNPETSQDESTDEPEDYSAQAADDGTPLRNADNDSSNDNSSDVSIAITAQYFSESSSRAIVKAIVENIESGTCKAIFEKNGQTTVTTSAAIEPVTSYFSCGSLATPRSKFSSNGTWAVKIQLIVEGGVRATSSSEAIVIP